jgi:hypothetical protein
MLQQLKWGGLLSPTEGQSQEVERRTHPSAQTRPTRLTLPVPGLRRTSAAPLAMSQKGPQADMFRLPRTVGPRDEDDQSPPQELAYRINACGAGWCRAENGQSTCEIHPSDHHQSLNVGSVQPPQTQGKVQSAVRLALSGIYLLQASARTGLIDCQTISNVPKELILPIITGFERW